MSFFNPLSFLLFLSVHSFNLFQMTPDLAKDLSGTYALINQKESILPGPCPDAFDIELLASQKPDSFLLKNKIQFRGLSSSIPRSISINGSFQNLPNGQKVMAEVIKPNAIEVQVFNKKDPNEKLVETFQFEDDGTMVYRTDLKVQNQQLASLDPICPETRYRKAIN